MKETVDIVGIIKFDDINLDVYSSLDEPLFKASDIANLLEYGVGNTWNMLELCEADEKLKLPVVVSGQRRQTNFVTERGLYNILEQSRKPIARKWRRVINNELIELRKVRNFNIVQQFDKWNHDLDNIYFDEDTGIIMESVTVEGGDVEQVPYKGDLFK